ncbi:MAG: hypothetical protein H7176_02660 [Bdellovibrionales bacterium]|nr:hypothetical protein [Massilia sp.]
MYPERGSDSRNEHPVDPVAVLAENFEAVPALLDMVGGPRHPAQLAPREAGQGLVSASQPPAASTGNSMAVASGSRKRTSGPAARP